jgi:long-chain acyl-CoA synthetase
VRAGVEKKIRGRAALRAVYDAAIDAWRAERIGRASLAQRAFLAGAKRLIFARVREQIGPDLSCLICGSAPLAEETQAWFELIELPVYQVYGLTETTAIVSMDRPRAARPGKVGHPIDACEVKLGEGDELLVRGPNVFAGYWNKPEATSDAFTSDGWFRTGDQARIDEHGRLEIVGRVKNILVPESGHNVAPEPIEQRLLERIPGLTQAVVIGHGRPYLTAILAGELDRSEASRGIDAINDELPHYRRIRAFHLSDELFSVENGLLTANQKLRRAAIESHYADAIRRLYA